MRYQSNSSFFSKLIDGELILLRQNDPYCVSLNETGAFLWKTLKKPKSEKEILDTLVAEYDIDEGSAKNDLKDFVKKGIKSGFLISKP